MECIRSMEHSLCTVACFGVVSDSLPSEKKKKGRMRDSQTVELDVLASWLIRSYDFDM